MHSSRPRSAIALAAAAAITVVLLAGCFPGLGGLTGQQQPTPVLKTQASFSPDGTKIAFISTASGEAQIYVANADGTNVRQLTSGSTNAQPTWSPDGTLILFSSNRSKKASNEFELFLMNADGSGQRQLSIELPATK
jgi:Tol biopolymer transport system component